jgi:hypothetical protein
MDSESEDGMDESYRDRIRAAIRDIAADIATVQEQITSATNEPDRAKARAQVLIAKEALEQGVAQLKDLAAQIPAESDDCGLFDTLAISLDTIESADNFIQDR